MKSDSIGPGARSVSVVIATLGLEDLSNTIKGLNTGSLAPIEILVCIPKEHAERVAGLVSDNVKIVTTPQMGQVKQRIAGFREAKGEWVLQLDDDVVVSSHCLRKLTDTLLNCNGSASVGPELVASETGGPLAYLVPSAPQSLRDRCFFWLLNGYKGYEAGKISASGVNMGFLADASVPYEVEWLPGGCVLHHRENLILEDFYPFVGKAFAEDLFHARLLRINNVRLVREPNAIAQVSQSSAKAEGIYHFLKIMIQSIRAHWLFVRMSNKSSTRFCLFVVVNIFAICVRKVKSHVSKR